MKYYLAYGSNLNVEQMARRCPGAVPVGVAEIPDYELVFRRGFLTIEPRKGVSVPVGVWKITAENERALDRYEGFPKFYVKKNFDVDIEGGEQLKDCMAYIMVDGYPLQMPTDYYFYTVYHGYSEFGLDKWPLVAAYRRVKWPEDDE